MICPNCKGSGICGYYSVKEQAFVDYICAACQGKGIIIITNGDVIRGSDDEKMATIIAAKLVELAKGLYGIADVVDRDAVLKWLQQPCEKEKQEV